MLRHPSQHPSKSIPTLSLLVEILLLVVEVRVVDAACTGDEEVDIPGDGHGGAVGGGGVVIAEFGDISEEDG